MKRILIVKITSLGDVVLAQPVVADLRRAYPGVVIDWATDAAFAEIPGWNPGVSRVHRAPLRQFKRLRNRAGAMAILQSVQALRTHRYDAVLDIHGAYKSAIVAFLARARRRYGYESKALGERGAGFAYSHRMHRPSGIGAVEGMRASVANTLGYTLEPTPDFGLVVPAATAADTVPPLPPRTALFLHGASKDEKNWPIAHWVATGQALARQGIAVALLWNSDAEHTRALAIAAEIPQATVLPRLTLSECARVIASAALVIGVDTGLTHLAHAFRRPSVMIFLATSRNHFGIDAPGSAISLGDRGQCPTPEAVLAAAHEVLAGTADARSLPTATPGPAAVPPQPS
ncbi:lipopolysaccharide heptosyltransferase I [Robbsia sp. Bb-Pol-6]|uniref:Lipopolysaccharide heptosyltransferase 1 n=1 Tax=Robbsia betulipollinis TaxID=2981849 RepID=A0ABT3ZSA9_9BURK|nr:lipopolysaccharide heptosyltransferase I [Robbsia betulipollinis]MCY0389443.1 lipopolysaccharide heptosyltransferase I [Robbsia betulipollinis]